MQLALLAVGAILIAQAATQADPPPPVHWTLHKSCFEGNSILEHKMVEAVTTAQRWAKEAASKMDGSSTKAVVEALCGGQNENKKQVIENFKNIALLKGPIGAPTYWKSADWHSLEASNEHWKNFIIVCSPDLLTDEQNGFAYDLVRREELDINHDFVKWQKLAKDPKSDWDGLGKYRTKAITRCDGGRGVPDTTENAQGLARLTVAQSINFHPLWIKYILAGRGSWSPELYDKVTAKDAVEAYRAAGMEENRAPGLKPVDGLIQASLVANVLHEFFHLYRFGDMIDEHNPHPAYGFFNNMLKNSPTNPDLYSIIGVIVELANQAGQKYFVDVDGVVTKAGS